MPAPTKVAKKAAPPAKKIIKKVPAAVPVNELSQARIQAASMPPIDPDSNSDLALALREMLKGGKTRGEVMHRVRDALAGTPTRTGKPKPVSTTINHALNRALAHGYEVVESWQLVPIAGYVAPDPEPKPATPVKRVAKKAVINPLAKAMVPPKRLRKVAAAPAPVKAIKKTVRKPPAATPAPTAVKRPAIKKPGVKVAKS